MPGGEGVDAVAFSDRLDALKKLKEELGSEPMKFPENDAKLIDIHDEQIVDKRKNKFLIGQANNFWPLIGILEWVSG